MSLTIRPHGGSTEPSSPSPTKQKGKKKRKKRRRTKMLRNVARERESQSVRTTGHKLHRPLLVTGVLTPNEEEEKKKTSINPIRRRRGGLRKLATDSSHTLSSLNYFLVGDRITRTHVFIRPRVFFSYSIEQQHFG